jgi:hypothetical protein
VNRIEVGVGDITGRGSIEFWTGQEDHDQVEPRRPERTGCRSEALPQEHAVTLTASARAPPCRRATTPPRQYSGPPRRCSHAAAARHPSTFCTTASR